AKDAAATANGFRKYRTYGAVDGLYSSAHLVTRGAMSLTSSTHFPAIDPSIVMKPVALLPGRGKLATKPLPIGSATFTQMTGRIRVSCSTAAVPGVPCERIRSGRSA